jgi:hypothetical protein
MGEVLFIQISFAISVPQPITDPIREAHRDNLYALFFRHYVLPCAIRPGTPHDMLFFY